LVILHEIVIRVPILNIIQITLKNPVCWRWFLHLPCVQVLIHT